MKRSPLLALVLLPVILAALVGPSSAMPPTRFPAEIDLPAGFQPEGIATGRGSTFYVGSLVDGAIYRGNLRTGSGEVFVASADGPAVGLEVDRRNRLWVAGGPAGTARVYDARTGALLASYQLTSVAAFVNDVVVTRRAAYFTDSVNQVLYVVPIGPGGRLGEPETLPITGDLVYQPGFNANGIEASPNGRTLLVIQSNTGNLYAVSAATGESHQVDLGGASLVNGDGLLRQGRVLYVVQNQDNQIAVVELRRGWTSGTVTRVLTDPGFDVPTTVARFGPWLYAVNARFRPVPLPPGAAYWVTRVRIR